MQLFIATRKRPMHYFEITTIFPVEPDNADIFPRYNFFATSSSKRYSLHLRFEYQCYHHTQYEDDQFRHRHF